MNQPPLSQYKPGEWLRVWNNVGKQGETIGYVVGHGTVRNHWTGAPEAQTVIIKNAVWEIEVLEHLVIERIDPVQVWERCAPKQPMTQWLKEHLAAQEK